MFALAGIVVLTLLLIASFMVGELGWLGHVPRWLTISRVGWSFAFGSIAAGFLLGEAYDRAVAVAKRFCIEREQLALLLRDARRELNGRSGIQPVEDGADDWALRERAARGGNTRWPEEVS